MRQVQMGAILIAAIATLATAPACLAQPGPPAQGQGMGQGRTMGTDMGQGMGGPGMARGPGFGRGMNDPASYLATVRTELAITPDQAPAWASYAQVVQDTAGQMRAMHASAFETMQTATPQERRDMMNTMFEARQVAFGMVHDAATKLLPSLSAAQQAKAATILPGLIGPGPRRPMP